MATKETKVNTCETDTTTLHQAVVQLVDSIKELQKCLAKETESSAPFKKLEDLASVQALHQMMAKISETIKDLENRDTKTKKSKNHTSLNCTFSGQEHEDPFLFIERMSEYFHQTGIDDDAHKFAMFARRLCGEARRWYDSLNYCPQNYQNLVDDFLIYFNAHPRIVAAKAHLYGEKQRGDEAVASFIFRKEGLFKRLHPEMPVRRAVKMIASQLKPEIRLYIRGHDLVDMEQLLEVAMGIEGDLARALGPATANLRSGLVW